VPGGVDGVLGAGGLMVRSSPGFEPRAGQLDLARQVLDTLSQGGVLLAEAGTGTGKTLAYLAAAVVAGQRVVVSTATRNLQDQIVRKDVPSLERALGGRLDAAVLKGRQNYLCTLRLEQARSDVGWGRPAAVEADPALEVVAAWAADTQTGDRAEVAEVPEEHPVWERLTTTSEACLGATCPNVGRCFVMRARAQAERARLLVVNHAPYFGDLAVRAGGGALPSGGTHCARSTVGGSRRPSPTGSGENIQRVVPAERAQPWSRRGAGVGAGERSPGADVGRGEPSPGADVAHRRACPATTVRAVQTLSRARSQRARAQSLR
jgi:hypothetical protein